MRIYHGRLGFFMKSTAFSTETRYLNEMLQGKTPLVAILEEMSIVTSHHNEQFDVFLNKFFASLYWVLLQFKKQQR